MPEFVNCNLCSSTEYRPLPDKTRYLNLPKPLEVVQCSSCGLVYMNPRFTPAEHGQLFIGSTFYQDYLKRVGYMVPMFPDTYAMIERTLGRCGTILEIGCATGHFLHVGKQRGWQVVGLEISEELAQYARQEFGLDVRTASSLREAGLNSHQFDVIYMSHVLEHLHDPRDTLSSVRFLIKDDGLLVIQVPNEFEDLLYIFFRRLMKHRFERNELPTDHLFFFTPQTINSLLEETGYRVIQAKTWAWRNRRNRLKSRFFGGYFLKAAIFALGGFVGRGPNIEVLARKA